MCNFERVSQTWYKKVQAHFLSSSIQPQVLIAIIHFINLLIHQSASLSRRPVEKKIENFALFFSLRHFLTFLTFLSLSLKECNVPVWQWKTDLFLPKPVTKS